MKVTEYTSDKYEGKIFSKEFCLGDLLKGVKEFDKETVRKIVIEFLEMLVKDLIDENNYFLFPVWKFGYMNIVNIGEDAPERDDYDIGRGDFICFQPVILGDGIRKIQRSTTPMTIYFVRFIGKTKKYFESVIAQNHHY